MTVTVRDRPAQNRFEVYKDDQLAGYAEYQLSGGSIAFTHTRVAPAFAGHGLGRRLVADALEEARDRGLTVLPFCPFVRGFIANDPDRYLDLVPARHRARFKLPDQSAATSSSRRLGATGNRGRGDG